MRRINSAIIYFLFVMAVMALIWARGAYGQSGHAAVWAITNTSCTSGVPCTAQIVRVALPGNSTCPAAGDSAYIVVQAALAPLPGNVTPSGTHWDYTDSGPSLANGSTYCGYSTVTSGGVVNAPSAIFQGTFKTTLVLNPSSNVVTLK